MKLSLVVLCCVYVNFAFADTYKAAVSDANNDVTNGLLSFVYEAGRKNVDVMVLPNDAIESQDYDENVKTLSKTAKHAGLYLVAHLKEKVRCQNKLELVRSNLVFDREGSIVAVKPENNIANCSITSGLVTFDTDFGVKFGVMMEEDLVLSGELKGLKNFVLTGAWSSDISYFDAPQFSATWSYTNNANLVSSSGIYAGRAGATTGFGNLKVAELKKNCDENITVPPVVDTANIQKTPGEDLSQYIIKPLDTVSGASGYQETVCHNSFCCEFYLKTNSNAQEEVSYGLAAFNGVRHLGGNQYIGAQNCAVFACAGPYKRSCGFGSVNKNTNIVFEKLTISANLTDDNIVYPIIVSNQHISSEQFKLYGNTVSNVKNVEMTVTGGKNLQTFGMFGRMFDRDYASFSAKENSEDFYNYIFTEDVQEFFDYLWIRVRILMFVVSIYILEML